MCPSARLLLGPFVFTLVLSACETPPQSTESTEGEIIGGVADNKDPAVVALVRQQGNAQALCTATLISPRVLLTAAHCIADEPGQPAGQRASFTVVAGGQRLQVSAARFNNAFDFEDLAGGNDVGVAILAQPIASIAPVAVINRALTDNDVGQNVRMVGFGINNPEANAGAGRKRQVSAPITAVFDELLTVGEIDPRVDVDPNDVKGTCNGDSGGPALLKVNGVERVVGITSFGPESCRGFSAFTRVDRQLKFIDAALKSAP
jgi:secreted trypsin-like serine protease